MAQYPAPVPDPNPLQACSGLIQQFGLNMTELSMIAAVLAAALQRRKHNRDAYIKNIANVQKVSNALVTLELAEKFKRDQIVIHYVDQS
jgi:hypothetical protein